MIDMKRKKVKRWLSLSAIALSMTVTVTGCRPSPILEDILYTADASELDPDYQAVDNVEDEQDRGDRDDKKDDEAKRSHTDEKEDAGKSDPEGGTDSDAKEVTLAGETESEGTADESSGEGAGEGDGRGSSGQGSDDSGDTSGTGSEGSDDGSDTTDTDEEDPDEKTDDTGEGNNVSVPSKADVPKKVVTDGDGIEQVIPEDVYTVTAVGPAASMIEMLGGAGRLLGSSESFTENSLAKTLFSDIGDIYTWWEDTGENAISDEDFNELLQESPDVCFEISGQNTFTEEQVARLKELEIGYLVLPELSTTDDLKDAVTIVANALATNESTGKNAKTIASNYKDWIDSISSELEDTKDKSTQYYTMYIKDYRTDISFSFEEAPYEVNDPSIIPDSVSNTGVAVIDSPKKETIFSQCLESGGIKMPGRFVISTIDSRDYYTDTYVERYVNYDANVDKDVLIHPFYGLYGNVSYSGNTGAYIYPEKWSGYSGIFKVGESHRPNQANVFWHSDYTALGQPNAPVLLVANQDIKEAIENDFYWQFHGVVPVSIAWLIEETWRSLAAAYPDKPWLYDTDYVREIKTAGGWSLPTSYGGGLFTSDFLAADLPGSEYTTEDKYIKSGIWDEYSVCVCPAGLDNWAEGGLETPLGAYWAANQISGGISDSLLLNRVRSFYKTFFGVTLSDAQIKEIIG